MTIAVKHHFPILEFRLPSKRPLMILVAEGATTEAAIIAVRQLRPGSIETPAQEDAVRHFEAYLKSTQLPSAR